MDKLNDLAVLLIHHSAGRGHDHPPNSLRALQTCLAAGARVIGHTRAAGRPIDAPVAVRELYGEE